MQMSDVKRDAAEARRRIQAAVWLTRLHAGGLTARAQRSWETWQALPENQRAFDSARVLWRALRNVPRPELPAEPVRRGESRSFGPAARSGVHDKQSNMALRTKVAASIAVLGIVALGLALVRINAADMIQTTAAEWMTVTLEDGSVVQLGPQTSLQLKLGERSRRVSLARGEAYFKVAKDPSRPFIVAADGFNTRAVGTEFAVSKRADGEVAVTVAEGVVMVYQSASNAREIELSAGKQVIAKADLPMAPRDVDIRSTLAWRERLLVLNDETIEAAVDAFNRRNAMQLKIADPTLAAERIVRGTFQLDEPESFAKRLERSGLAVIVREQPDVLRLEPGPALGSPKPPG
jgi:transmembrane sensor